MYRFAYKFVEFGIESLHFSVNSNTILYDYILKRKWNGQLGMKNSETQATQYKTKINTT